MWHAPASSLHACLHPVQFIHTHTYTHPLTRAFKQVHAIHHMMAALLFFKTLSLLFEAVRYHSYQVGV